MSPTALDACDHHDSFSLPAQDQSKVHPSARRTPEGGLIKVESDSTVYEADGIKAKFTDRGASVISRFMVYPCLLLLMALQRDLTASSLSRRRKRTLSSLLSPRLAELGKSMS